MQQLKLSDFSSKIRYIPLETVKDQLIGAAIEAAFLPGYFLIKGINSCLLYDDNGKFIRKIGSKGRGPGEYQYGGIIGFDKNNNVYIKNMYDLIEYNINGTFVKKYSRSFLSDNQYYLYTVFPVNDSLFLGHVHNSTGLSKYKALLVNKSGKVKKYYMNYVLFNRGREIASGFEGFAHIYRFNNELFYKGLYNDTLFILDKEYRMKPRYVFNLGRYKEPVAERAKIPPSNMMRYFYLWDVFQTDKYLFVKCQMGDRFPAKRLTPKPPVIPGGKPILYNTTNALGVYNKKTREFIFCKPTETDNPLYTTGLFNDLDAGPKFFPAQMVNDTTMMMYLNVKELKDHISGNDFKNNQVKFPEKKRELEKLVNSLSDLDNQVIMIVTFNK